MRKCVACPFFVSWEVLVLIEYMAPDGTTWQFEQDKQPNGYVQVTKRKASRPRTKRDRPNDKQAAPKNKGA